MLLCPDRWATRSVPSEQPWRRAARRRRPTDAGEEKPSDTSEICALGLRVEADCADLARAARSAVAVQQAHRRAEPLLSTFRAMTGPVADPRDAWTPCHAALGEAEWSRLQGRPDPQAWQRAAEHWEWLELPHRAAYARF